MHLHNISTRALTFGHCAQIAAEKARKAEEAAQREAAERERREAEEAQDRTAARARAVELRESVAYHRQGAWPHPYAVHEIHVHYLHLWEGAQWRE